MKFSVLWDIGPCSLVAVYRRFRGAYCIHHHGYTPIMRDVASHQEPCTLQIRTQVFCDVPPCSHVEVDRCFRGDDGGSTHLRNVGQLRDYMALHPR
jgi:hypothetical protein